MRVSVAIYCIFLSLMPHSAYSREPAAVPAVSGGAHIWGDGKGDVRLGVDIHALNYYCLTNPIKDGPKRTLGILGSIGGEVKYFYGESTSISAGFTYMSRWGHDRVEFSDPAVDASGHLNVYNIHVSNSFYGGGFSFSAGLCGVGHGWLPILASKAGDPEFPSITRWSLGLAAGVCYSIPMRTG